MSMGVRRTLFACAALASIISPPEARAQSEAGLLLGMACGETLWITATDDGDFQVAARNSRLIVPRDDGYWWTGTEPRCAKTSVPQEFTASAPLPIPLEAIKRRFPRVVEVFTSPSGSYLLVREPRTVFLVRLEEGGISDTMLEIPADPENGFVMMRWASTEEAKRWNTVIPTLAQSRLKQTGRR
jgi:hypothetical protein